MSALLFAVSIATAQTTVVVSPAPSEQLSIAMTPFGFDEKIIVGSVDNTGEALVNREIDFGKIPDSVKEDYWVTIGELLSFCDNFQELFADENEIEALELGPLFLFKKDELSGFITLVSDTTLYKWVKDPEYETAVPGSYFEAVYVSKEFAYQGGCDQTMNYESGDLKTHFDININLDAGLNFIEYKIESVYEKTSPDEVSTPRKLTVLSHSDFPANALWMAFYYY